MAIKGDVSSLFDSAVLRTSSQAVFEQRLHHRTTSDLLQEIDLSIRLSEREFQKRKGFETQTHRGHRENGSLASKWLEPLWVVVFMVPWNWNDDAARL
jgi:hypothetical protein